MFIDIQLFGSGKGSKVSYTRAQVPAQTETEKQLEATQLAYANSANNAAKWLLSSGTSSLAGAVNPDYNTLYNNAQAQTGTNNSLVQSLIPTTHNNVAANTAANTAASNTIGNNVSAMNTGSTALNSAYDTALANNAGTMIGLTSGTLPTAYANNRQQALQSDLTNTVGNTLSGLASRGIINSSQADSAINDISKNASNTLAANYTTDMNTASGLANTAYNNQLSGLNAKTSLWGNTYANNNTGATTQADIANNAYTNANTGVSTLSQLANQSQQMATDPITTAAAAQYASTATGLKYLAAATGQNAPTSNLLTTLGNQRYSVATPSQAVVSSGGNGLFGNLLGAAATYYSCFVAGTKIATPTGGKKIEAIKSGDYVLSGGPVEKVIKLHKMGDSAIYTLKTKSCKVDTTETEAFKTPIGMLPLSDLIKGDKVMTVHGYEPVRDIIKTDRIEPVYELEVTGVNLFFANGILAEGLTDKDKKSNGKRGAK